ncbi:hypothetical protein [Algiphilus sp.]|uniref:hypothetical protein n=1 Tax=Algiphilus sp. TaxID=1872431 RepID=UPI0025BD8180|nr:hypothetical protein [Algiphilus sp.]MCK5771166.1 hypothetical protein [Algiphilus sp.]
MTTSSSTPYWVNNKTARALWKAYQRMMEGKPKRVSPTARMTLSSVAVEAGFQRSTLSRKRYPDLAELIEQNAKKKPGQSMRSLYDKKRVANANLRSKLETAREERGVLLNRIAALERRHLRMTEELGIFRGPDNTPKINFINRTDSGT